MRTQNVTEFRVLGPLEARAGGRLIPLGGAKQRALLAALLLRAGEVVPVARLIDEIWGDRPPPSAAHSLEAYVSRLRQLLNGHGPSLMRRGSGYALELGDAVLDANRFSELADDASRAADEDDPERASRLASAALALWRGPALADVALASAGRAEAERLEELRLRTLEQRFDAGLALGRDEELVGELQVLVGQNPYRERFVAQLMLALYRSGRHADALAAYERIRTSLDDDLGLQPSAELQQLSAQIVRQEPQLERPARSPRPLREPNTIRRRVGSLPGLLLAGAGTVLAMAFTSGASAPAEATAAAAGADSARIRVALVMPRGTPDRSLMIELPRRVRDYAYFYELGPRILFVDESDELEIERVRQTLEDGGFGLVLVLGDGAAATGLAPLVKQMDETKFIFLDASLADLSLKGVSNAGAVRFADEQTSQLIGYLSALVPTRGSRALGSTSCRSWPVRRRLIERA